MRRASVTLGSFAKNLRQTEPTVVSKAFFRDSSFQHCTKTNALLLSQHHVGGSATCSGETDLENSFRLSSRQRKLKERHELEEEFESATNVDDMLRAFNKMQGWFSEEELGMAALKIGLKLDKEGGDPQKTLDFASRALKALDRDDNQVDLYLAMALQLMGSANCTLKKFNDSLGYLNRAKKVLAKLEGSEEDDVKPVMHAVLLELANVKIAMGRWEEAMENLKKCLDIKEMLLDKDSKQLGIANREIAKGYIECLNFKEALHFALKALQIHENALGERSVEVARDRSVLGVIYAGLEEHEKAIEHNKLSRDVFSKWGLKSDLIHAEIASSNMQIAIGNFEEAISTLRNVVQHTEKDSRTRALVFIALAKALHSQGKPADSKTCLDIAFGILEKMETSSPVEIAEAYFEIALEYEAANEFDKALSLFQRTLSLIENDPQEQHTVANISSKIGWLLLLTGKVSDAIPHLETAAETLKECFGPKHFGVGYVYNNLGAAYMELDRPQTAAQIYALSKEIMDLALGPYHADSIEACQNLSKAYDAMGNYQLAIHFQHEAVDAWESHGPSAQQELAEARRVLDLLMQKTHGEKSSTTEHNINS